MFDFEARHVIEALRSGVPSRTVGEYFSDSRPAMKKKISDRLEKVRETGRSDGMIFTGRYGEGKTHMLNTVFNQASALNMVVSLVPLGKETPVDKPHLLYPKIIANTYLPGAVQPGFREKLESITEGSSVAGELLAYAAKELETDKLYFMLKAFLKTQEEDEKYTFLADLEGDFTTGTIIKRSYRRVTGTPAKFNKNFSKTKHSMDYYYFMSHLFKQLGFDGWVLLFDEAELMGRLGKKTRAKSYRQMQAFLRPDARLEQVFSLFALSASYVEDVIDKKKEFDNADSAFADDPEALQAARATLDAMVNAPELAPLTKAEVTQVLMRIQDFHGRAYNWHPDVSAESLYKATEAGGYLLRTKLRAAIEYFDQLYQYGEAGETIINELGKETFAEEEDVPELDGLEQMEF